VYSEAYTEYSSSFPVSLDFDTPIEAGNGKREEIEGEYANNLENLLRPSFVASFLHPFRPWLHVIFIDMWCP
jgi:hypothetical protein